MTPDLATDMPDSLGDIEEGLRLEKFGMRSQSATAFETRTQKR
jgi:hypothetical protein